MPKAKGLPEASLALTPVDWGYIGGLIDADGSIGIYRTRSESEKYNAENYYLRLIITNNSVALMDWLKQSLGGGVDPRRIQSERHSETYNWHCTQFHAAAIIRQCRASLKVKADQADVALEFIDGFTNQTGRRGMSPEVREQRRGYWRLMASLKGHASRSRRD